MRVFGFATLVEVEEGDADVRELRAFGGGDFAIGDHLEEIGEGDAHVGGGFEVRRAGEELRGDTRSCVRVIIPADAFMEEAEAGFGIGGDALTASAFR